MKTKKNKISKEEKIEIKDQKDVKANKKAEAKTEEVKVEKSDKQIIEELKAEVEELKNKNLRSLAEFENFRRRNIADRENWIKNANKDLILEVCDVMDNFERAFENKEAEAFHKGIELIYKQLDTLLKNHNVQKIEAMGKEFDHDFCQALAQIPSELPENHVAAVIKNGWMMNETIIRTAQVAVSKPKQENKEEK